MNSLKKFALALGLVLPLLTLAQTKKPAYLIYTKDGKKVSYDKMVKALTEADMLMFGEYHNNPISHWLQLELTRDLYANDSLVMLGAEMFERDNQTQLNQYLSGGIDYDGLDSTARLWKNYKTDYAPLVDFAKDKNLQFIATNIPRRYASKVYKGDFTALDSLSKEELSWIAPLPIKYDSTVACYKNMAGMMPGHGGATLAKAQALKDATMAYSILENYKPNYLFIHYNGSYHSNNHEGIVWYLKQDRPELIYKTVTTVSQKDINKLLEENIGLADFIICVDDDMTTTY